MDFRSTALVEERTAEPSGRRLKIAVVRSSDEPQPGQQNNGVSNQLLEKNSEGTISPEEKVKLEQLVAEAEKLMVANAGRPAIFAQKQKARTPSGAVPVTIWVQLDSAKL
jgi:hypothetical protein